MITLTARDTEVSCWDSSKHPVTKHLHRCYASSLQGPCRLAEGVRAGLSGDSAR